MSAKYQNDDQFRRRIKFLLKFLGILSAFMTYFITSFCRDLKNSSDRFMVAVSTVMGAYICLASIFFAGISEDNSKENKNLNPGSGHNSETDANLQTAAYTPGFQAATSRAEQQNPLNTGVALKKQKPVYGN